MGILDWGMAVKSLQSFKSFFFSLSLSLSLTLSLPHPLSLYLSFFFFFPLLSHLTAYLWTSLSLLGLEVTYSITRISVKNRLFTNIFVIYSSIFLNSVMIDNNMKHDMNKFFFYEATYIGKGHWRSQKFICLRLEILRFKLFISDINQKTNK